MSIALTLLAVASAADEPHLWVRGYTAVAAQPVGLIADVAVEARTPVLRYGGAVSNDTFAGAGVRVAASPAHLDLAARATFKPLDILPITVEGVYTAYWESPWGVIPRDQVAGQRTADRQPAYDADEDFAAHALAVSISPTLQLKVGPIAAFTNVTPTWIRVRGAGDPDPWLFEPYRGMVIAPDDRIVDHLSAVLFDPFDGDGTPIVRIGPMLRGRAGHQTGDVTLMTGGILQLRPGRNPHDADLTLLVAPYLRDPDFAVGAPYIAALVSVARVVPFKKVIGD
ncbi:MAG: hypothetical protein R3F61_12805 [Myxococcota bacterium]